MDVGTECRLRCTQGDLSGGTRVHVKDKVGRFGRVVQTIGTIPVLRHLSFFDGDGIQRHRTDEIRREHRELLVDVTDLVPVRRR